jgi:hypothetical protein
MKKAKSAKSNNQSSPSSAALELFGGLKMHELEIEPINVFALKIEHCEEPGYMGPGCGVPMPGPAPVG